MYRCANCDYVSAKWLGRCPECGAWDAFVEERKDAKGGKKAFALKSVSMTPLSGLSAVVEKRVETGIAEFDRVLGGGLVTGEVTLVGGEPGIGKSTLLLEVAARLARNNKVLYISAEESLGQVSIRARRLGVDNHNLLFAAEDVVENILPLFEQDFAVIIVDSIQVIGFSAIQAARGSMVQVREAANALTDKAKKTGTCLLIVGHVTKEGAIAGPKLLEHVVDCVIYFEGERNSHFRILRAVKNRFGSIGEIGVFEMTGAGLEEVSNPSTIFVSEEDKDVPGRCIGCVLEGIRPILIEVQSLTADASYGVARRKTSGFDFNKYTLILAMIEKRLGINLAAYDVFLNVTGGMRINDPTADLAAAVATVSAYQGFVVPPDCVFIGEVGLLGELRSAPQVEQRLKEASRMGFKKAFIPRINYDKIRKSGFEGMDVNAAGNVQDVFDALDQMKVPARKRHK
jgi:DNA repair protein RadA/Sms